MSEKAKPASEIIIKLPTTTPAEKHQIAADVVASLNRRGILAAEVDFSDLERGLQSFILKQAERLTEAARECIDPHLQELLSEMAKGWIRLAESHAVNGWQPISTAPLERLIKVATLNREGYHPFVYPVRRTADGWVSEATKGLVDINPTHWSDWTDSD
jgi:hypothetical protein